MPQIIACIEARMGSSRLPGKTLADVCGKPALERLAARLGMARTLDGVVLATSTSAKDDVLEKWARDNSLACFRGSEDDVLGRVVGALRFMDSDIVVEVTGDCILLDPQIVDMGVRTFLENDCDVVTNVRKPSFPMGMDVQVFGLDDLARVAEHVDDPAVREHVSLYFYEHPERYRIIHLMAPERWEAPSHRFQLDYPEDLRFINEVYARLEPEHGPDFGIGEIMALLRREPELADINIHCEEKAPR